MYDIDNDDKVVFSSGDTDTEGRIIGVDPVPEDDPGYAKYSTYNTGPYEEHYTTIEREDQVQVYEGVMVNKSGEVTHTLFL